MRVPWLIIVAACSSSSSSSGTPQGVVCQGDAGMQGVYESIQVGGQCGGNAFGMTPAGQPCRQSSDCAPTCCACPNGSPRTASVVSCPNGYCASANVACCAWASSQAMNNTDCK